MIEVKNMINTINFERMEKNLNKENVTYKDIYDVMSELWNEYEEEYMKWVEIHARELQIKWMDVPHATLNEEYITKGIAYVISEFIKYAKSNI